MASNDAKEGPRAFAERRTPNFTRTQPPRHGCAPTAKHPAVTRHGTPRRIPV
jgi:hypothetical protein